MIRLFEAVGPEFNPVTRRNAIVGIVAERPAAFVGYRRCAHQGR